MILTLGKPTTAQDCPFPDNFSTISGNNIRAGMYNNGALFNPSHTFFPWGNIGMLKLVSDSSHYLSPSTIQTNGIWIAAIDSSDNLRLAAAKFPQSNDFDFSAGPIENIDGQLSIPCENYNRSWEVFGIEIKQHQTDFADNGIIDNPIQHIYAYPAQQNPHFAAIHGFDLPNSSQGLAPFFDQNNDSIYNPDDGDFPLPEGVSPNTIPTHIIWGVFNDAGHDHLESNGEKLNIEIQLTSYAFYCNNNEALNNTIFTSHKIINRGDETLDSLFFSLFVDFDIGCKFDDYIGCIPDMNTFYAYNKDTIDGLDSTGFCINNGTLLPTFGNNPPVQAISFLNQEMSSFSVGVSSNFDVFNSQYPPYSPHEYFNFMNGKWSNGDPLTYGALGYGGTQIVTHTVPDNPNDPNGWSMVTANLPFFGFPTFANCSLGNQFHPNDFVKIDMAYTTYQDSTLNNLETVNLVYGHTPTLQQLYNNQFENCEIDNCSTDCVWIGDADQDSMVTNFDYLQVGLNYGATGTARNAPLIWQPFESQNWDTAFFNTNLKHADCNANAIIDRNDLWEIKFHFGKSYKTTPSIDTYNSGPELSMYTVNGSDTLFTNSGQLIFIRTNQTDEIAGLAFTVEGNKDHVIFYDGSPYTLWNTDLINSESIWRSTSIDPEKNEFHGGYVRLDGQNSPTKNDKIALIRVIAKDTSHQLIQTTLKIKNIKAVLADGTILDYGSQDFLLNIVNPNGNGIILQNKDLNHHNIKIFPNPTSDILNIKLEKIAPSQLVIFDALGKQVLEKNNLVEKDFQLSTANFSEGIYFLKIEIEGKTTIKKFIKM